LVAIAWLLSPGWLPRLASGSVAVTQLVRHGPGDPNAALPEGFAFVNRHTPPQAKLMLLDYNRGFWCDRRYVADSFFEASQLAAFIGLAGSVPQLRDLLTQLGITHIYRGDADWGVSYSQLLDQLLADPRLAENIYQCRDRHCALYALRPN
jgi:hypothetical protein